MKQIPDPMSGQASDAIVVFMTAASEDEATRIADRLVNANLAACVQMVPGMVSVYRWEGRIERQKEILLIAKSTQTKFSTLEQEVRTLHSYETPEIVAIPLVAGSPRYLQWLFSSLSG